MDIDLAFGHRYIPIIIYSQVLIVGSRWRRRFILAVAQGKKKLHSKAWSITTCFYETPSIPVSFTKSAVSIYKCYLIRRIKSTIWVNALFLPCWNRHMNLTPNANHSIFFLFLLHSTTVYDDAHGGRAAAQPLSASLFRKGGAASSAAHINRLVPTVLLRVQVFQSFPGLQKARQL